MTSNRTEIFCDGSVSNAVLVDEFTSMLGDTFVGRVIVVIPSLNYGLIEQVHEGVTNRRGNPDSNGVETTAIRRALGVCAALRLGEYTVLSDCQGAVAKVSDGRVQRRRRDEMYLAGAFFEKLLRRGGYLRQSRKTRGDRRKPLEAHQREIFDLFRAPSRQFRLSESALWARVRRDAPRHLGAHGPGQPA
jgi:ribonuclease HI